MGKALEKPDDTLYERDFYAWTQEQAAKLRGRAHNDIDWENAAEEIESLGRSDKYEIEHRMEVLLLHLLKWKYQPEKRKSGWRATITEQRGRIDRRIKESPSLRDYPSIILDDAYRIARAQAEEETGLPFDSFPEVSPFTVAEVLDGDLPGNGDHT
jgi:hypothetical protein